MRQHEIGCALLVGGLIAVAGCRDAPSGPRPTAVRPAADLQAATTIASFTASDLPIEVIDAGQIQFRDDRILWRGLVVRARIEASDPRFTGFEVARLNADWSLQGEGPVWGTITLTNDAGGTWDGEWRARRTRASESEWRGAGTWSVQGRTGDVAGLHAWGTEAVRSFEAIPSFYVGERYGRITGEPAPAEP